MFRFTFGRGDRSRGDDHRSPFNSPPPPRLDLAALKREEGERLRALHDALASGVLPPNVERRLRSQAGGELPWTSDLSVNEWAALRPYRLRPLGQVVGSCFYHVGYVPNGYAGFYTQSHEMGAPTRALTEGRSLALARMEQEARALGANAVVGVHLQRKRFVFENVVYEFAAYGTAVRVEGLPESREPLLCTVSGQDFARLLAAGALPVGLAMGASFYYLRTDWWDTRQQMSFYNQEMTHFQRGLSTARQLAGKKLRQDTHHLGAKGVVGTEVEFEVEKVSGGVTNDNEPIEDHLIIVFMMGTAVEYISDPPERGAYHPVLDMRDKVRR